MEDEKWEEGETIGGRAHTKNSSGKSECNGDKGLEASSMWLSRLCVLQVKLGVFKDQWEERQELNT